MVRTPFASQYRVYVSRASASSPATEKVARWSRTANLYVRGSERAVLNLELWRGVQCV